jgi:hypothetical protein
MIKSYIDVNEEMKSISAAITPGMLVEESSTGTLAAPFVQVHSVADGNAMPKFAIEDESQGKDIDDDYAINTKVQVRTANRGDWVYALLADGETAVIGSQLVSNGDGYLKVHVPDDSGSIQIEAVVAKAKEAVDMSGSSGADPSGRITVEVI